jgi:hypothetical protein
MASRPLYKPRRLVILCFYTKIELPSPPQGTLSVPQRSLHRAERDVKEPFINLIILFLLKKSRGKQKPPLGWSFRSGAKGKYYELVGELRRWFKEND